MLSALTIAASAAVVANNFFSADLVGFSPGSVVDEVELPNNDRILPRLLAQQAGFANQPLPRTIANQFDLDTTGDLAVLAYAGGAGPRLHAPTSRRRRSTSRASRARRGCSPTATAEVLVAGRVGSQVWQYLEAETACRIRMYSEERGMQAAGRDTNGEARSLLAFHLQAVGPRRFFAELARWCTPPSSTRGRSSPHLGLQPSRPTASSPTR